MSILNTNNNTPSQGMAVASRNYQKRATIFLPTLKGSNKQLSIRPESPRTREAMEELGIDISQFSLKNLEDFGGDGCTEDIQKLRYDHYLERLQQDIKDIQERRMHNIKSNRQKMMNLPPELILPNDVGNARKSILGATNIQIAETNQRKSVMNSPQQNQFNMSKSMSESRMNPRQMKQLYNKTVGYLRGSHYSPNTQPGEDVIGFEDAEGSQLEYQLMSEIDKYNRLKEQKQKEAKILYEDDIERLKTIERMREKEMRLLEQTLKIKKEKDIKKQLQKKLAEEKLQKVKESEQKYNQMKRDEREKIKKKLDVIKDRQLREFEDRERIKRDQVVVFVDDDDNEQMEQLTNKIEERARDKRQKMDQIRLTNKEELVKHCDLQYETIRQQLQQAQEQQRFMMSNKINKLREKLESEQTKIFQCQDLRESNEKMQLSKLVQKLVEKEEHQRTQQEQDIKFEMDRKKALKEKAELTQTAKNKVKNEQNNKISELKQKFEKTEQNLERKKKEEQDRIKLKQEFRHLKEQDKQENYERQKRRDEYRLQKLMEKEKAHAEKIQYIKQQQEILKKAKYEVAQQTKHESERIFDCVKKVTDTLFPNIGNNSKSTLYNIPPENKEKGVGLLKSIFRNDQLDMSIFEPPQKEEAINKKSS